MFLPNNRLVRVYVAGAITGDPNFKLKFKDATDAIKSDNPRLIVYNPARVADFFNLVRYSWEQYMRIALDVVPKCDIIYFLKDYVISHGAKIEMEIARKCKKIIVIQGQNEPPTWRPADMDFWLKTNFNLSLNNLYFNNDFPPTNLTSADDFGILNDVV